jgi:hypothetical protein
MVQKDGWKNVLDFTKESLMKEIKFIKIKDYVGLANINFNKHELDLTSLLNEDWEIQETMASLQCEPDRHHTSLRSKKYE